MPLQSTPVNVDYDIWEIVQKRQELLPNGWKVGTSQKNQGYVQLYYISPQGKRLWSSKRLVESLIQSGASNTSIQIIENAFELSQIKVGDATAKHWEEDEELPKGWKIQPGERITKYKTEKNVILLGTQGAIYYMKKSKLYSHDEILKLEQKLERNGWRQFSNLPYGWRCRENFNTLNFITYEGKYLKTKQVAVKFMESSKQFSLSEMEEFKKIDLKHLTFFYENWTERHPTLPKGWQIKEVYRDKGAGVKRQKFKSPGGKIFNSRKEVAKFMTKKGGYTDEDFEKLEMNQRKFQDFKIYPDLPKDWMFKKEAEDGIFFSPQGNFFRTRALLYKSDEYLELPEKCKAMIKSFTGVLTCQLQENNILNEVIQEYDSHLDSAEEINDESNQEGRMESKHDWKVYSTLPIGWKCRKFGDQYMFLTPQNKIYFSKKKLQRSHEYSIASKQDQILLSNFNGETNIMTQKGSTSLFEERSKSLLERNKIDEDKQLLNSKFNLEAENLVQNASIEVTRNLRKRKSVNYDDNSTKISNWVTPKKKRAKIDNSSFHGWNGEIPDNNVPRKLGFLIDELQESVTDLNTKFNKAQTDVIIIDNSPEKKRENNKNETTTLGKHLKYLLSAFKENSDPNSQDLQRMSTETTLQETTIISWFQCKKKWTKNNKLN